MPDAGQRRGPSFRRDPLAWLTAHFDDANDVWRPAPRRVVVAAPAAAREVLSNRDDGFLDTSDFFHTRAGVFGPRSAQVEMGRMARGLLLRHLAARRGDLPRLVGARLGGSWPDAGNHLILEHLRDVLLGPDAPAVVHEAVDAIVARAVLAGARQRHSAAARLLFRRAVTGVLGRELQARRTAGVTAPHDLLDVVAAGAPSSARLGDLVEVYLSFLFATVGSIGFALGWSVYLVGAHPGSAGQDPDRIVREALRLWPVAWLFARAPARVHDLAGVTVRPADTVSVCTYLVHRHPRYWERPDAFVPQRWAERTSGAAFLPFGVGPHACPGATGTVTLLTDIVDVINSNWRLSIAGSGGGPLVGPALAPPRFTVQPHDRVHSREGR